MSTALVPTLLSIFPEPSMSPPTFSTPVPHPPSPWAHQHPGPRPMAVHCNCAGGAIPKDSDMNGVSAGVQCTPCSAAQGGPIRVAFPVPTSQARPPAGLSFISPHIPPQVLVSNPDGSPASKVSVRYQDQKLCTSDSGVATLIINTDANMKELPISVPAQWGRSAGGVV